MDAVLIDLEQGYRAVTARDARFDGQFILAVRTTGIYCRPSCPAITPKRRNVEFYPTAAAAQQAGYRACRRCLPDAVPGSPEWNLRADLAGRAMRLISDGIVEREGVPGLARRVGYSERHLTRVLTTELGAGPLALARAHRAHSARLLIETTTLPLADVAFAAGFASVRQFNDTIRAVFGVTPTELRMAARRRARGAAPTAGRLTLRLPYRPPFDAAGLLGFLAARAIPGVESVVDDEYARTLSLPHGQGTARLRPADGHVECTLRLTDMRDLGSAVARLRRLLDLDADPGAVDELLSTDPALAPQVAATPGIRLPGCVDAAEIVSRALIGQQITVAAARTALGVLSAALGDPLTTPDGDLTTLFPTPAAIAARGAEVLTGPRRRIATMLEVNAALAAGSLEVHVGADPIELSHALQAFSGVGPWTAGYVQMRVLGATDVLLAGDVALRNGARALGLPSDTDGLTQHARTWQPWRSYAGLHLWRASTPTPRRKS
ncbi:MAG TPA: AlkA N-terminal domain-containing protein [Actinophytocola sp.]|jgi:AraC family transcriptional regulator of adaptative response / DNA-3-methyladenine glycosylase II|uniref:AlkA N-terminal domain-containing protein n=1 Tax=Actinophytocola sp. TaxID=1872138 RepID=UPI002E075084|nr:AlkA N-terminal domain-containing protein [Actinophytocola sp.]